MNGRGEPRAVVEKMREEGWLIKAPPSTPGLQDCIRITLARPELMEGVADALGRVLAS